MNAVRAAVPGDLDAVVSLERAVFDREAWSPRSLEQEFAALSGGRSVLVAVAERDIVGYGVLSCGGDTGDLRRLAVARAHRRHGIATRLVVELLGLARKRGCERTVLEVAADNAPALALYERLGFSEIARRPRYYPGSTAAVVMQLGLADRSDVAQDPA